MNKKYIKYDENGTILSYQEMSEASFNENKVLDSNFWLEIDLDSKDINKVMVDLTTLTIIDKPPKVPTIEDIRLEYKLQINDLAGIAITERYPTYRQINYNREPTAPATIEMNLWIDDIRAESNIATSSIDSATDLATIEGIVDGFKAYLAGL